MTHAFLDSYSNLDSPIHRLDARAKIVSFFALIIICVTTLAQAYFAFAGYLLILLAVLLISRLPLKHVMKRSLVVIPFVLIVAIFIPFLNPDTVGGGYNLGSIAISRNGLLVLWNVVIKSYIGVLCMILLSSTTPFNELLEGFRKLKVPGILINIAAFMYRYLFVVTDEAMRMKRAGDSRNFGGRWIWHSKVIGHMIGTLFLRSYERGERVYLAMLARGYNGEVTTLSRQRISIPDVLFAGAILISAILIRASGK
ncbi:cobalt/nickel transport system permease protein [Candidatus Hakubella thermalkaliphila]|uniref:Cobalt/nickel transport system permease protein n=2 Tax=Candidatus Hakubella thermalkaliphila TaxID=2754717 RepID=A0A6V8NFY2_9ACTN|nr:cobalt ECF transporter T component CbiQ [Candidatus Hakubella thermalkaliphila]GFP19128.1 cobalt/nickel transport system permease protein [Candidatus Hakubella thermalkaliphila]GFP29454.1 cobalt/nickel transport system permease protein [Candidatus Hakubella thermalkaliphila]GFP36818.1 cobalt/nickel transport system permease protein [Candidatus Hakubella thermalkaliphila]GFP38809.1 cobalt/nickel transport system permease protein [Candidatus Hakubella thermalkaliphila]